MKLRTISNTLSSLAYGINIGMIVGLVLLSQSVISDPLVMVLGVFLIVLSWILMLLSWQIDTYSDAEEVNQW